MAVPRYLGNTHLPIDRPMIREGRMIDEFPSMMLLGSSFALLFPRHRLLKNLLHSFRYAEPISNAASSAKYFYCSR